MCFSAHDDSSYLSASMTQSTFNPVPVAGSSTIVSAPNSPSSSISGTISSSSSSSSNRTRLRYSMLLYQDQLIWSTLPEAFDTRALYLYVITHVLSAVWEHDLHLNQQQQQQQQQLAPGESLSLLNNASSSADTLRKSSSTCDWEPLYLNPVSTPAGPSASHLASPSLFGYFVIPNLSRPLPRRISSSTQMQTPQLFAPTHNTHTFAFASASASSIPRIFVHVAPNGELEEVFFAIYSSHQLTLCLLFEKAGVGISGASRVSLSLSQLHELDEFLSPRLSSLSAEIAEQFKQLPTASVNMNVNEVKRNSASSGAGARLSNASASPAGIRTSIGSGSSGSENGTGSGWGHAAPARFVYFNSSNLAQKTTIHADGRRNAPVTVPPEA